MAKGFNGWIEVFRAGEQTDSSGNTRKWTSSDLEKIVENYNAKEHEAPVVIGHPKDNAPAFGWVEKLKMDGEVLLAKFKDLIPEFVEAVEKGLYKKRSISLYPDLKLRHIGFLGAMPPAVKGLADIQFSEEEIETYEFADNQLGFKFETTGRIFQNLREFFIEKYDLESADKVIPQWWIEEIKKILVDNSSQSAVNAFCEKITEEITKMTKAENANNAEFAEQLKAKDAELAKKQAEIEAMKAEKRQSEFNSFCEGLIQEGKLTPAQKELAVKCFEEALKPESYEFSEDGKNPMLESVKNLLNALPKQIEFGEHVKKESLNEVLGDDPGAIAQKALEFQQSEAQKGRIIRIDEAVQIITEKKGV